jgi:hypothetical protein
MCNLEIHMGMENHVLLGQQNQEVVIVSVWQEMSYRHCCTKLGFVIRRHSFYPFFFWLHKVLYSFHQDPIECRYEECTPYLQTIY